jgi:translocation and assembly module TamB
LSRARQLLRGLVSGTGWLLHWWPGALLALLLALGLVLGGWAHSAGSFQQALGWAQLWAARHPAVLGGLHIQLDPAAPPTSIVQGGHIAQLTWSRDGLSVTLDGLQLEWTPRWWLALLHGDGVQVQQLRVARVWVRDQRPATPTEPLQNLTLPMPVSLPFEVGQIGYHGASQVVLGPLRGHYRHNSAQVHHLQLDELGLAQGRYSGTLTLAGAAPMAVRAELQGRLLLPQLRDEPLQAQASVEGTLAGAQARLRLQGQLQPSGPPRRGQAVPQASVAAEILPWAAQPVHSASVKASRVDLSVLWPGAPRTDLSGTASATPGGGQWRAEVDLANAVSGPWDAQRLPLETLRARVLQTGTQAWRLEELNAFAAQGRLQAQGSLLLGETTRLTSASGSLQWTGLNPAALLSTLPAAPLHVAVDATSGTDGNRLNLVAQPATGAGGEQPLALRQAELQGRWQGDQWTLDRLHVALRQAQLSAQGEWNTTRQQGSGQGSFSAPGASAQWRADLAPETGQAQLDLQIPQAERLLPWLQRVVDATSPPGTWPGGWSARDAGSLQIDWQGGWQTARRWWPTATTAPELRRLAGQPALPLSLRLSLPTIGITRDGQNTRLSGWNAALTGSGGRWQLSHQGQIAHLGHSAQLDHRWTLWPGADGPRLVADHLRGSVQLAQVPAALARWQWQATAPLALRWLADGAALDAGSLELLAPALGATPLALRWEASSWLSSGPDAGLRTGGTLSGLPLGWLDQLARSDERPDGALAQANLQGDLVFDSRWALRLPASGTDGAQGELTVERRSGDLALRVDPSTPGGGPLAAGVSQAVLGLQIDGPELSARLRWDSQRAGRVDARARTRWAGGLAQPSWPADAPLTGSLQAALPQVGLWSVLAPPGWRMNGSLQVDAELAGTREAPRWSGQLRGDGLALRSLVEGIEFAGGELRASLRGEQLLIERFSLEGPGGAAAGGQLRASGSASWAATTRADGSRVRRPVIQLAAQAERLRVSVRADRRLTVSGDVQARLQGKDLQLRGGLSVDQAAFVLPDEQTPRLGDDVVVRGRGPGPASSAGTERVLPDVLLTLRLGDQFQVRGHGLDTRLAGELELRSTPAQPAPRLLGEVRTARGTYRAYGQRLDIEQGVLRFAGPFDNPALDVLAIRPFTSQRVGVVIRGTAQAPQVRLYSDPELPDSEKLAWLVLGRSASGGGAEAAVLQQAAIALLSGGNRGGLFDGLFGLDEISVRGTGESTTNANGETVSGATVTLGKRLSSRLYVAYERSLAGTLGTLSLFYDVSKRLTLRARTGEDNAVDLIFTLPYD